MNELLIFLIFDIVYIALNEIEHTIVLPSDIVNIYIWSLQVTQIQSIYNVRVEI